MPLDAICIRALCDELKERLIGGRIDKVQQPERSMLLISVRSQGENLRLLFSAGTGSARVHITKSSFENPAEPPMFCMLMRKHLIGARITGVEQPGDERALIFILDCFDEMGVRLEKRLVAELIGRSSNFILVGEDGRIIDCMRRMDYAGDPLRRMLPGMIYRLPPVQNKIGFLQCDEERIKALAASADRACSLDKWLLDNFSGLSPLICRELSYRCSGDYDRIPSAFLALQETVLAGEYSPGIVSIDSVPKDFSFMPISQYGDNSAFEPYDRVSELLDDFYSKRDRAEQQRRRAQTLSRSVKTARDRLERKLTVQYEEYRRTLDRDNVRIRAELLTANIYRIKRGDRSVDCENYYEADSPLVRIQLDPLKTPQENSAALFREYSKLKGANYHLSLLIDEGEKKLEYLNSVLDMLDRAQNEKDISDIRRELVETGFLKKAKAGTQRKLKEQQPIKYISDDGYEILVGRSNIQNDMLTFKMARRTDRWLHVQKIHGSHVIIKCDGLEPPELTLQQAASIAVYHSQGRGGGKTAVDHTMVRNVRKPTGALPGKVIYSDYSSLMAQADEALVERLMVR